MKKSQKVLILYATCAIIWTITTIISIINKLYEDSMFLFVMDMLCAVLWFIAFIVELKRNKANKE